MTSAGDHIVWPAYGAVSAAKCGARVLRPPARRRARAARASPSNALRAGVTDTPALRKIPGNEGMIERVAGACIPAGRLTTPADVARALVALCGAGGAWVSRQRHRRRRRRRHRGRAVSSSPSRIRVRVELEPADRRIGPRIRASSSSGRRPASASSGCASNGLARSPAPEPRRPGRDLRRRLPRRQPQRGRGPHGRDAPARAPHVQGHARVRPREGDRRRRGPRGARGAVQRHDVVRPDELLRDDSFRQARGRRPDRGLADAPRAPCATRTACPR